MGYVYLAENTATGKRYVGKTDASLKARIKEHIKRARLGSKIYFHSAIRKYGPAVFVWSILFESDQSNELSIKEKELIITYASKVPLGYNLTDGGDGTSGYTVSAETRKKLSLAQTGKRHSAVSREKMSMASRGKPKSENHLKVMHSEEYRQKLRTKAIGRGHSAETKEKIGDLSRGRKHSEETKRKISQANKGRRWSQASREKLKQSIAKVKMAK